MKIEYTRPNSIHDALEILNSPNSMPLAGGTYLNTPEAKLELEMRTGGATIALVDLQGLGLDHIRKHGNSLEIDACVSLQQLCENVHTPENLKKAIKLETPLDIRNMATVAGTLVACNGRSAFACAMLALDAKLFIEPGGVETLLGNYLPLREGSGPGKLITKVTIPLNANLAFEHVGRTKFDLPIVCSMANGLQEESLPRRFRPSPLSLLSTGLQTMTLTHQRERYHEAADDRHQQSTGGTASTLAGRTKSV
jgi:CO/xanthine dehydrogenase FAD-binding subunit